MLKNFPVIILTIISINVGIEAQSVASSLWNLVDNQSAVIDGNIVGGDQELSNMQATYASNVQRSSPTGTAGTWPGESSENVNRFMQFRVSPKQGNFFTISSLSLSLYVNAGSGMRANIYYSKDSAFSQRTQVGSAFTLSSSTPSSSNISASPNISIADNEIFYVRIYPWYISSTTSKYVITNSVLISGSTNSTLSVATLLANPKQLSFGYLAVNKDTAIKSFTLSGSLLNPGGGVINLQALEDFEISLLNSTGFSSIIQIPYLNDSLPSTIIFTRFIPTESKTYNGNIVISGGGAETAVALLGTGVKEIIDTSNLVGFATLDGGTTGGTGGDTVFAADAQQIADIMLAREKGINTPLIIFISGVISGYSTEISVKRTSNISIIGLGVDAEFLGFGMKIVDCKNIIVQNIMFADCKVDEKDGLSIDGSNNVWIDHCSFTDSPSVDLSGSDHDGQLDIKSGASNITVSYNHFMNHRKTCLLGHTTNQVSDTTMKVTYYRNWFDGTYSRQPRIRFAKAHLLNNLYSNVGINGGYGVGVTCQAQVLVEGNYFENTPTPILISTINDPGETLSGDPVGFVKTLDNYSTNSGVLVENLQGFNFDPRMYYSYTSADAQSIKDIVKQNAGVAKLDPVVINESQNSDASFTFNLLQNYPNPFNPETVISWQLAIGVHVILKIYDVLGNEVTTLVNEYQSEGIHHKILSVKNNTFASGIYFYQLQVGNLMQMKKMIILK